MLQKLYRIKKLEETLGIVGIIYLIILACITILLVRFLVGAISFKPARSPKPLPPAFQLSLVEFKPVEATSTAE